MTTMKNLMMALFACILILGCQSVRRQKTPESEWISVVDAPVTNAATSTFWRRVVNRKDVRAVHWTAAGLGVWELYANGRLASAGDVLKSGPADSEKTCLAFSYDVTEYLNLKADEANDFGAEVFGGNKPAFRGLIDIVYEDGTTERVVTCASEWFGLVGGPVMRAEPFGGETFDARLSNPARYPRGGFIPGGCERSDGFDGDIRLASGGGLCLRRDLAVRQGPFRIRPGEEIVVDFGQDCTAVPSFVFKASRGTVLTAVPGVKDEEPEGTPRIVYTFAGTDEERYESRFTCLQYRYLTLKASAEVEILEIARVPVTSIRREMEVGDITTGDERVNRLVERGYWQQLANALTVPTPPVFPTIVCTTNLSYDILFREAAANGTDAGGVAAAELLAWLYGTAAGIADDPSDPGFRHLVLKPQPDRRLASLDAIYDSAAGLIKSAWHYEDRKWVWTFTVPEGSSATVTLPGIKTSKSYSAGTYRIRIDLP